MELKELIGKNLANFTIQELTEVYETDVEGRGKIKSIGFFKNETIATGFAGNQTDAYLHKTQKVILLTDGKDAFIVNAEPVKLLDDEEAALEIRNKALDKLSPQERELLGL
jgi:hypothetical protein